jgi:chromosome segregation ATPase
MKGGLGFGVQDKQNPPNSFSLDSRVSKLLVLAKRVPELEDRVAFLDEDCRQLRKTLVEERNKAAEKEGDLGKIKFDRNEALKKVDTLQEDMAHLQGEMDKVLKREKEHLEEMNQLRARLTELGEVHGTELKGMKTRTRELENALHEERLSTRARVEQKVGEGKSREIASNLFNLQQHEMQEQMVMMLQIKERTEEQTEVLQAQLMEYKLELDWMRKTLEKQKRQERKETKMDVFVLEEPEMEPIALFEKSSGGRDYLTDGGGKFQELLETHETILV